MRTLASARQWLFDRIFDGTTCPLCDQRAQVYRRGINGQMAYGLFLLYKHWLAYGDEWVHMSHYFTEQKAVSGNDGCMLRYWGLIEPRSGDWSHRGGIDPQGHYRITEEGRQFVEGKIAVPKYVWTYNEALWGMSGDDEERYPEEWVSFRDCQGKKFDLSEVMDYATNSQSLGV